MRSIILSAAALFGIGLVLGTWWALAQATTAACRIVVGG